MLQKQDPILTEVWCFKDVPSCTIKSELKDVKQRKIVLISSQAVAPLGSGLLF